MFTLWRLLVCFSGIVCFALCDASSADDVIDQRPISTNSKFKWIGYRTDYVMPWTRGPNVCAVEEVGGGSRKRFHSECMAFVPRRICKKSTFVRYHCCTGYEKDQMGNTTGCQAVKPIDDLLQTAQHLFLKDFRKHLVTSGYEELLVDMATTYTVFAPHNKAFVNLSRDTRELLTAKAPRQDNLLLHHIAANRFHLSDLRNGIEIPTQYKNNGPLIVHRYSNGIVTVNCVRIVQPNQPATNGIIHVTEQVIRPVDERGTIFDILSSDDRFDEFVAALELTLVSSELKTASHYTVFAPTNVAFRAMDQSLMERVMKNTDLLKRLIRYHIIDCCICSAAILGPTSVRTLEGLKVNLSCDYQDRLLVNDIVCSEVDIVGSNGVGHVIDRVLVPDSVRSAGEMMERLGIRDFLEYAKQSGMKDILEAKEGSDDVTIFAPNDQAFNRLTASEKKRLTSNKVEMKEILDYHTAFGTMTTTKQMVGTELISTGRAEEKSVLVNVNIEEYTINNARIISGDHVVANGVIHIIDRVLFPPDGTIIGKIKENPQLSTLLNLLQLSGLDVMLTESDHPSWTLFAPTNAAFDRMDDLLLARLMEDRRELVLFLNYHLVEKGIFSCGIRPRLQYRFKTVASDWVRVKQKVDGEPIVVNERTKVTQADIQVVNGVLHVIDHVLICPCLDWSKTGN